MGGRDPVFAPFQRYWTGPHSCNREQTMDGYRGCIDRSLISQWPAPPRPSAMLLRSPPDKRRAVWPVEDCIDGQPAVKTYG